MAVGTDWARRIARLFTTSLSDLNPIRRDEPFLSLDIGSSSIKALEMRGRPGQLQLINAASIPTPASAIQNNMVYETAAVAEAVRALVESHGMHAKKVVTAVPGPAVIIKRVTLPAQTAHELE